MAGQDHRLPAEWERQSATLLAWPHAASDWAVRLPDIRREYCAFIQTIALHQPVVLITPPGDHSASAALGDLPNLHLIEIPCDDTWCRDFGPIIRLGCSDRIALDFQFKGWGGKYAATQDNKVNIRLAESDIFAALVPGLRFEQVDFELEGGAIETDGRGTLLINWHCLRQRHPDESRADIENRLMTALGVERVLGIDLAPLPGDDTDGHIDTIARFLKADTIAWQVQPDETRSQRLRSQLESLRQVDGQPYSLLELPLPAGVDPSLPANYANFLFINDACLVPAYGVAADEEARTRLAGALPDRSVHSVPARAMIEEYGGPHCASMHIPALT